MSNNKKKPRHIHIIGDLHQDVFVHKKVHSEPKLGGIAFIEKVIRSKPFLSKKLCKTNDLAMSDCSCEESCIRVTGDYLTTSNTPPSADYIDLGLLGDFEWNCDYFDAYSPTQGQNYWYLRCTDQLVEKNPPINSPRVYLHKDKLPKDSSLGEEDYFLLECHGPINNDGTNEEYKGAFKDEEALFAIFNTILNVPEPSDHNEQKSLIPKFFWIVHNDFPPFLKNKGFWTQERVKTSKIQLNAGRHKSFEEATDLVKNRSVIFLNANALRKQKIYIRKHISWESAAQDYICALYSNPLMEELSNYRHIITRFGLSGAVYSYRLGTSRWLHRLIFDPKASQAGLFRDASTEGDVVGYQTIYATCVLHEIMCYLDENKGTDSAEVTEKICDGIRKAMASSQKLFSHGIGPLIPIKQTVEKRTKKPKKPTEAVAAVTGYWKDFGELFQTIFQDTEKDKNDWLRIGHERIPVANPAWTILVQSAEYKLFELAITLVQQGVDKAFNNPIPHSDKSSFCSWAPVIRFDDLIVIDRREIESYRVIHGLIRRAINEGSEKPLSIAVFGPPGSGKSFTVKRLVQCAQSSQIKTGFEVINLTKVKDPSTLEESVWLACGKQYFEEKLPVIFFDEFDCKLGNDELGWLKVFLSPMEDMGPEQYLERSLEYYQRSIKEENNPPPEKEDDKTTYYLKQANEAAKKNKFLEKIKLLFKEKSPIFVFAGGTSHNYRDFCHEDSSWSEEQIAQFRMAKGPDFVSRLRGHIDIIGPNRVDDYDDGYVIRRAILLRELLLKRLKEKENGDLTELVDQSIISAMLRVSSFKHGARSMQAIINMSCTIGGPNGQLVGSMLPTLAQLNMHVNGKEYLDMVINESQRRKTVR